MLVDAETLEPARDGFSRVFGEATERIKPELFESFVEITTPVVETAEEVEARAARAAARGRRAGSSARARACSRPARIRPPADASRSCLSSATGGEGEARPRLYRQQVCGLHVHVSVPDPDTCLRAFEGVVPRLPALLAASANSPYWDGADSGWRSIRSQILLEMPTGGTPPVLRELGRLAGRDRRRQHAPPLGRLAAAGVRDARGARPRPADVAAPDGRVRSRGAAARAGGRGAGRRAVRPRGVRGPARRGRARGRRAGGRTPARARAGGAVQELVALTLG